MSTAPIPSHIAAIERPRESLMTYYVLTAIQKVFYGPVSEKSSHLKDIGPFQFVPRAILVGCLVFFGIFPQVFLDWISVSTKSLLGS